MRTRAAVGALMMLALVGCGAPPQQQPSETEAAPAEMPDPATDFENGPESVAGLVAVEDVTGLRLDNARAALEAGGFIVRSIPDSAATQTEPGTVTSTDPAPGTELGPGSIVTVVFVADGAGGEDGAGSETSDPSVAYGRGSSPAADEVAPEGTADESDAEQRFLEELRGARERRQALEPFTDEELLEHGRTICDWLEGPGTDHAYAESVVAVVYDVGEPDPAVADTIRALAKPWLDGTQEGQAEGLGVAGGVGSFASGILCP